MRGLVICLFYDWATSDCLFLSYELYSRLWYPDTLTRLHIHIILYQIFPFKHELCFPAIRMVCSYRILSIVGCHRFQTIRFLCGIGGAFAVCTLNWQSCQDRIGSHCQKGLSRGIIRYVVLTFWMDGSSTLQSRVIVRPFGLHHLRPSSSSALTGRIPLQEQPLFSSFIIKRLVRWMTVFHWNAEMICPFKKMQWHLEQSWQLRFICTVVNNYAI